MNICLRDWEIKVVIYMLLLIYYIKKRLLLSNKFYITLLFFVSFLKCLDHQILCTTALV